MSNEYKLSKKYKDFIKNNAQVECLEGTTAAGKTTVGILKAERLFFYANFNTFK